MGYHTPHRDLKVPQSSRIVVDCRALSPSPTPCFVDFVRKKQFLTVFYSSPVPCTNKKRNFCLPKVPFFVYPSRRLGISSALKGWISSITANRYCISSRFSVYLSCDLMIYKAYALICLQKYISIYYIFCLLDLAKLYIGKHKSKIEITPTNMQPTF